MGIKVTIPNTSLDYVTFGSANTTTAAQIAGIDSGSSNGQLALYTTASGTSTERVRVDSSGNVRIGTTSDLSAADKLTVVGGNFAVQRTSGITSFMGDNTQNGYAGTITNHAFALLTNSTERARIDSSGNLGVGTTTPNSAANYGFYVQPAGNGANIPYAGCSGNSSSNSQYTWEVYSKSLNQSQFYVGYAGTVYARSTSITGLSDVSEKENIKPLETGLNEILALQPRRFDWKNGQAKNIAGFIAQEVQPIFPDLIDEFLLDKETQETKLGLKMGDMIPTLVKAIQEQQAIITQLQADVAALKGTA